MLRRLQCILLVLGLAFVPGCSWFSSDEEVAPEQTGPKAPAHVAVTAVRSIEIGRTRDGVIVTATGTAPGLGYGKPRLVPRRDGKINREGFLEFDFVAIPPDADFSLPTGSLAARSIRADAVLPGRMLKDARGIRVFGAQNGVQFIFTEE